jgi:hypothetical protein
MECETLGEDRYNGKSFDEIKLMLENDAKEACNENFILLQVSNAPPKNMESPGTVPAVAAANSQSVTALSEIVWDWLTENAVDVMVDECDVNILIQRLNAGVPALHT